MNYGDSIKLVSTPGNGVQPMQAFGFEKSKCPPESFKLTPTTATKNSKRMTDSTPRRYA
jgi:hypothetical protein